jgi:ribosomal protein L7Ae-like RNA K-turn-binding protein
VKPAGRFGLLGLGQKAGTIVVGTNGIRAGLQRGEICLVVLASDRGTRTEEKVGRLARGRGIPLLMGPAAQELGRLLGRETVQAVGVRDARLAAGLLAAEAGETESSQEAFGDEHADPRSRG